MQPPDTRYAKSGDLHIAYQVFGDGRIDLVFVPSWYSHVEAIWEWPEAEAFLHRLASFSRVIIFDQRGTGMSDPIPLTDPPTLEVRMDDIGAVMEAANSEKAAVLAYGYAGPLGALFAATHPERTSSLVLSNTAACFIRTPDYPIGVPAHYGAAANERAKTNWGRLEGQDADKYSDRERKIIARYQRMAMSPATAVAVQSMNFAVDVRDVLPSIGVPTLVLHKADNPQIRANGGRFLAERIAGARFVELPGDDTMWMNNSAATLDEIEEFLTGTQPAPSSRRVLSTVLFTDIVGSTEGAAEAGDHRWVEKLKVHDALVLRQIERHDGRLIQIEGDGVLATFDGPARGIRCAIAIRDAIRGLGLEVRAGLHTGEIELLDDDIAGIAVHIGKRVSSLAIAGEVMVSSTVKDLVVGSGIDFDDRGYHELKGVPGEWRIYAVSE